MNLSDLKNNSYTPYSGRPGFAVVQGKEGTCYPGVRIENISFPLTISAIQNALFFCLSEGDAPQKIYINKSNSEPTTELHYWQELYNIDTADIATLDTLDTPAIMIQIDDISTALRELLGSALVDESDFPVAALLETKTGFIPGVNIELPDWSRGLCAERVALAKAVTFGYTDFKSLHVHTRSGEYSSPCGACRQVIGEHLPHHPLHLYHADGSRSRHFTSDLLPYSFQSLSLQNKSKK